MVFYTKFPILPGYPRLGFWYPGPGNSLSAPVTGHGVTPECQHTHKLPHGHFCLMAPCLFYPLWDMGQSAPLWAPAAMRLGKVSPIRGPAPNIWSLSASGKCLLFLFLEVHSEEINPEYSLEGWMRKLKLQSFDHLMWGADSLEKPWCWETLKAKGEAGCRGWDG